MGLIVILKKQTLKIKKKDDKILEIKKKLSIKLYEQQEKNRKKCEALTQELHNAKKNFQDLKENHTQYENIISELKSFKSKATTQLEELRTQLQQNKAVVKSGEVWSEEKNKELHALKDKIL